MVDIKMVLLHEHKLEEGIKSFFLDVWESYLKVSRPRPPSTPWCCFKKLSLTLLPTSNRVEQVMMNPFQDANSPIENASFDAKVRAAAKKFL